MSTSPSPIGERIREARELVEDLSARELAVLAGLAPSLVAHLERGEIQSPRTDTLTRLSSVLGVSLEWLIIGGDSPAQKRVRAAVAQARAKRVA